MPLSRRLFVSAAATAIAGATSGLRAWCASGGERLSGIARASYEARLDRELDVISRAGASPLLTLAADCAAWARSRGLAVAPGHRLEVNSLAAFSLGITTIDPVRHDLMFERFCSPEPGRGSTRVSLALEPRAYSMLVERTAHAAGPPTVDHDPRSRGPEATFRVGRPDMMLVLASEPALPALGPFAERAARGRLDDSEILAAFARGDVRGVHDMGWPDPWQPELPPISRLLRRVQPTSFEALVATKAVHRWQVWMPEVVHEFLRCPGEALVFQEQVTEILSRVGGMSLGQADVLRRRLNRRDEDRDGLGEAFVRGAVERGTATADATRVFRWLEEWSWTTLAKGPAIAEGMLSWASMARRVTGTRDVHSVVAERTVLDEQDNPPT